MDKQLLKKNITELSNKLDQSDGVLLDIFFDNADQQTLENVVNTLKRYEIHEKLQKHFDTIWVRQEPDDYPDEWRIKIGDKETHIEVKDRKTAVMNELDYISDIEDRNEFLEMIATDADPEEIGAYTRIETNLYYKEF